MAYAKKTAPTSEQFPKGSAEDAYLQLMSYRDPYLVMARDCAKFTIPKLVPPEGAGPSTRYYRPWQSIGGDAVNVLSAKFLVGLLPPNNPFFRFTIDDIELKKAEADMGADQVTKVKTEIDTALALVEKSVAAEIELLDVRNACTELFRHLIVAGNCVLHVSDEGARIHKLTNYVCKRSARGTLLKLIIREEVTLKELPATIRKAIKDGVKLNQSEAPTKTLANKKKSYVSASSDEDTKASKGEKDCCFLYTSICLLPGGQSYEVWQEIQGIKVPGSYGKYTKEKLPWMALRFVRVDGEHYGRSFVDDYLGSIMSLDGLNRSIVEGSAMAAKGMFFCNPNGITKKSDIEGAENGAIVSGRMDDVSSLQLNKFNDFRVALETIQSHEQRIERAFLMDRAVQRDAERVTAEEVRIVARELESALGGIYSFLAQEFQKPLVTMIMARMQALGRLPQLPKEIVKLTIVTGLEALGRGQDYDKLMMFLDDLAKRLGPEITAKIVNPLEIATRAANYLSIQPAGLLTTPDAMAQQTQQSTALGLADKLGGPAIKALSDQVIAHQGQPGQQPVAPAALPQPQQ